MHVAIIGAHGDIARQLTRRLSSDGHTVTGVVRKADQFDDVRSDGGEPALADVETAEVDELARVLDGADAVVFAAGAGPGSGAARKKSVDRDGAILTADAADAAGVGHIVVISSMGADDAPEVDWDDLGEVDDDDVFGIYLAAKAEAEEGVSERPVPHTIIRPGGLTDDEGTGTVTLARSVDRGEVPRADVAHVLATVLEQGHGGTDRTLELVDGDTDVAQAVKDAFASD